MPQEHHAEAFQHAFDRYGDSDEERQLLPARDLRAWIERKLFLRLDGSPFDREDATLLPEAGACLACSKRSGANGALFEDVTGGCCLDRTCWNAKVETSVQCGVEAKPELVQIATDYYLDREDGASDPGEAW